MDNGMIGGIAGGVLGVFGGIIGTYFSIVNTRTRAARRFMIRASIIAWLAILVFLTLMLILPTPERFLLWIPYGIALPLGIRKINTTLARLEGEEDREKLEP